MSIKLVSLNIEGKRHLRERILPFLREEKPDVVCLQEVFKSDIKMMEKTLGMTGIFVPLALMSYEERIEHPINDPWGLLILSRIPIKDSGYAYYFGNPKELPVNHFGQDPNLIKRALVWIQITNQEELFQIATTHFAWSFEGVVTGFQEKIFKSLCLILKRFPKLILTGDFNTPRGGKIFSDLASRFKDNIPSNAVTTIDNAFHRSKDKIQFVVDGLFSSPKYKVSEVSLVKGISDHFAIVCKVSTQNLVDQIKTKLFLYQKRAIFILWKILRRLKRIWFSVLS